MEQGLIHVYHGDGKGKTTAAIGLCIRAAGNGKKVIFSQFMKGQKTGELSILKVLPEIKVLRSDRDFPFYRSMTDEDKVEITKIHNEILKEICEAVKKKEADLVVLDEITYPYAWGLLNKDLFEELLHSAKGNVELVMTGRNPDNIMLEAADYITEAKCIRHPYDRGITAREGIEY